MGVAVEVWRARIGNFNHGPSSVSSNAHLFAGLTDCGATLSMCLALVNILLLIGCVEANPGPIEAKCTKCEEVFHSVVTYAEHQAVHSLDNNSKSFPCYKCGEPFWTVKAFSVHFSRKHSERLSAQPSAQPSEASTSKERDPDHFADVLGVTYRCSEVTCQETFRTKELLRKHVLQHLRKGYVVICPIRPCPEKFTKVSTFQSHFTRFHVKKVDDQAQQVAADESGITAEEEEEDEDEDFDSEQEDDEHNEDTSNDDFENLRHDPEKDNVYPDSRVRDLIVKFYLWLEGVLLIPATKVQSISEKIALMCEISHHRMRLALHAELSKAGLDQAKCEQVTAAVLKKDLLYATHHKGKDVVDITTEHMRKKFYKQKCAMLDPEQICLGPNDTGKRRFAHFISIKQTLNIMFTDPSIRKLVQDSFKRPATKGIYQDFTDGSTFTKHPVCGLMDSIQLIFFQDAFEFYPLSPIAGSYKCVGFYFVLGNMHANSRSKVDAVQLAFLVKEKDLKFFTPEVVLEKLINELKDLAENGIEFDGKKVPVVVTHMCGDNLGQHFIGGFLENFRAHYACRFCQAKKEEILKNPSFTMPFRKPEEYDKIVGNLNPEDPDDHEKGIKKPSVLNNIPFFHVCTPSLPPCAAHGILEGTAKKDYALFLRYFVEVKKWISISTLNRRISNFKCLGRDSADSLLQLDPLLKKIRGHASEVWLFVRLFPFLLGDKVQDLEDPVWKLCLLLKSVCEYVFAPTISEIQLVKLKGLIFQYVETRAKLFNADMQPKHHYMCHYAELTTFFGPLIRLWTMRFEARHVFFKNAAQASNNFKNITATLVSKYVLNFAYKFTGNMCTSISFRPQDESNLTQDLLPEIVDLIPDPSEQRTLKSVDIYGIKYEPGLWLILGSTNKDLKVGEILLVLYNGKEVNFIVKIHKAINSNQGFYAIQPEASVLGLTQLKDLVDYYPLPAYIFQSKLCLTLKHTNPSMDSI